VALATIAAVEAAADAAAIPAVVSAIPAVVSAIPAVAVIGDWGRFPRWLPRWHQR
jgi:hypothetical protein